MMKIFLSKICLTLLTLVVLLPAILGADEVKQSHSEHFNQDFDKNLFLASNGIHNLEMTRDLQAICCDDGNACTQDYCGSFSTGDPGTPCCVNCIHVEISSSCDDGNPCTNDSCVPASGCVFIPSDLNSCTDNNISTTDQCVNGQCKSTPIICNDNNPCTDDIFDLSLGKCVYTNDNTNTCAGSNACMNGRCVNGLCESTPTDLSCSISKSFSGPSCGLNILLQTQKDANGVSSIAVKVSFVNPTICVGDIRGVFFHIFPETKVSGITVSGTSVTSYKKSVNAVQDLGNGADMKGDLNRHKYDVGVQMGTKSLSDDIQVAQFIVKHTGGISTANLEGEFGVSIASVGINGGTRNQISKVAEVPTCQCWGPERRLLQYNLRGQP